MPMIAMSLTIWIDVKNHMELVDKGSTGAKRWLGKNIFRGRARAEVERTIANEVTGQLLAELGPRVQGQIFQALADRGVDATVKVDTRGDTYF